MSEVNYKKVEKLFVIIMLLGIVAMFQPWFKNIIELFEPLAPDAKLGRTVTTQVKVDRILTKIKYKINRCLICFTDYGIV